MNYYNSLPVLLLVSCNEFPVKSRPDLFRILQLTSLRISARSWADGKSCLLESNRSKQFCRHLISSDSTDINGQMEDQDTGRLPNTGGFYEGPPIHQVLPV